MIPLSVAEVARITSARLAEVPDPAAVVTGPVVIDSRAAVPGSMFAALPGTRTDGHEFALAAANAGAVAALAARPVGCPALIVPDVQVALGQLARAVIDRVADLTVIGITGSVGKTTTKDLTAQLLETLGPTIAPRESFNNEIGHPLTALRVTAQTRYLVSELAARGPGHITQLCRIAPPRLGAVLCVGHAHAGEFGSLDAIAAAKGELPAALPADGVAVLNADDQRVAAMADRTVARVITFGRGPGADVRAERVRSDECGRPAFLLTTPAGSAQVRLQLYGEHHVTNALAAAALAQQVGMPVDGIAAGLTAAVARSRWRMEVTRLPDGITVVNDAYNANPDSVRAAIAALKTMSKGGRGFAVLGHMTELGDGANRLHQEVGAEAAAAGLAGLIVVGAEAEPIVAGARTVPGWQGELALVPDAAAAVGTLRERLREGDVVLVKASHSIHLERVALALTGEQPLDGETRPQQ
ncbi:MAG: UDP-N-acetylmuramoyl-tripeptide--D-alanyl-D-alanine ligase [Actinobacteria bacterium]|nr:UDP-N-acetylmuramoyl-tripeptide--D-alanyl-D-alanine ligase [Actinomycetota bacterium]MBO0837663.1 UDP-N-acetylmuramoyl-tripeptide--D-alanyl-D-alanine ligase [Actinomycetota bacterium]